MAYCLQATCCQREYKDKQKRKHQCFCGKLACQVYPIRNADFTCKSLDQILQKHVQIFVFCAKFDPNNYIYCDVGLQTKYTFGIEQGIFPKIPSIQDGK